MNSKNVFPTQIAVALLLLFPVSFILSSCRHDAELPPIVAYAGDSILFDSQVLPMIVSNCSMAGCHDGNGEKFPLLNYQDIRSKVKPGKPYKSSLYQVITAQNAIGNPMPPAPYQSLTNNQITIIQLWIMEGARDISSLNYCDSIHVNYSGTIHSIFQTYCISCHSGANPSANLTLTTYDEIKYAMVNKALLDHLQEINGYSLMPQTGPLPSCNIAQIKKWYNDGLPND